MSMANWEEGRVLVRVTHIRHKQNGLWVNGLPDTTTHIPHGYQYLSSLTCLSSQLLASISLLIVIWSKSSSLFQCRPLQIRASRKRINVKWMFSLSPVKNILLNQSFSLLLCRCHLSYTLQSLLQATDIWCVLYGEECLQPGEGRAQDLPSSKHRGPSIWAAHRAIPGTHISLSTDMRSCQSSLQMIQELLLGIRLRGTIAIFYTSLCNEKITSFIECYMVNNCID